VTRLLDISVLLALAWPQQASHSQANRWIELENRKGKIQIATSPITQLGFVRISMNVKGYAQDFDNAMKLLVVLTNRPEFNHEFWPDDVALLALHRLARPNIGPAQLTDFYLVNLAKAHNGRLVTLDKGIKDPDVEQIAT
jgi:uncharacterized protein